MGKLRSDGTQVNCEKEGEEKLVCRVQKDDKKAQFGFVKNEDGKPSLDNPKGDMDLIKETKDDVAEMIRLRGMERVEQEF